MQLFVAIKPVMGLRQIPGPQALKKGTILWECHADGNRYQVEILEDVPCNINHDTRISYRRKHGNEWSHPQFAFASDRCLCANHAGMWKRSTWFEKN